jgi:hypothetical protein
MTEPEDVRFPNWPAMSPARQPPGASEGGQGTGMAVSLFNAKGAPAVEQLFPVTAC